MANNHCQCTPECGLKATKKEYNILCKLLEVEELDDHHGFSTEYSPNEKEYYMYAEDFMDEALLPKAFLKELGKLIKKNKLRYLTFGYACTCDRLRAGEFGGGYFRINTDGKIKYPKLVWS